MTEYAKIKGLATRVDLKRDVHLISIGQITNDSPRILTKLVDTTIHG